MKSLLFAGLVAVASAQQPLYPACQLEAKYTVDDCNTIWSRMSSILTQYVGDDGDNGTYDIIQSLEGEFISTVRQSKDVNVDEDNRVQEVNFYFNQYEESCFVTADSQSTYPIDFSNPDDNYRNYCNDWNLLYYSDVYDNLEVKFCSSVPENAISACSLYGAELFTQTPTD